MSAMSSSADDSIPAEMKDKLSTFDSTLTNLEAALQPLLSKPRMELFEKASVYCRSTMFTSNYIIHG